MKEDLHDLNTEELGRLFPIVIAEPNAQWIVLFEKEKFKLQNLLGEGKAHRTLWQHCRPRFASQANN